MTAPATAWIGDVCLGDGGVKVIAPIVGADHCAILDQAGLIAASDADLVEWRADFFDQAHDTVALKSMAQAIRQAVGRPLILTVRTQEEGGRFSGDPDEYERVVRAACACREVDAVDVQYHHPAGPGLLAWACGSTKPAIASCHYLDTTPPVDDLIALLATLESTSANVCKVAVWARDAADAAALISATTARWRRARKPMITMAMGEQGAITRLIAREFGSAAVFAVVAESSAPGQPSLAELRRFWAAAEADQS